MRPWSKHRSFGDGDVTGCVVVAGEGEVRTGNSTKLLVILIFKYFINM